MEGNTGSSGLVEGAVFSVPSRKCPWGGYLNFRVGSQATLNLRSTTIAVMPPPSWNAWNKHEFPALRANALIPSEKGLSQTSGLTTTAH